VQQSIAASILRVQLATCYEQTDKVDLPERAALAGAETEHVMWSKDTQMAGEHRVSKVVGKMVVRLKLPDSGFYHRTRMLGMPFPENFSA